MINKAILPYINKIYIRFFTFFGNHFDAERERKGCAKSNSGDRTAISCMHIYFMTTAKKELYKVAGYIIIYRHLLPEYNLCALITVRL